MKAFMKSLLALSLIFFSVPLFAGQVETKAAKAECTQEADDYGIEKADQADYILNCVEEYILEETNKEKDTAELDAEQTEEYETEQANN